MFGISAQIYCSDMLIEPLPVQSYSSYNGGAHLFAKCDHAYP